MMNGKWLILAVVFLTANLFVFGQESGGAKGKIRNQKGDELAGVLIEARQNGETIAGAKTARDGTFLISGLKTGIYDFLISKDGYSSGSLAKVEIKAGKPRNLGDNLALATDEGTLAIIRGSVFDQNGRSVTGAKVEIAKVTGEGTGKTIATSYTTISGDFVFKLPSNSADYRISVSIKGAEPAAKTLAVSGAQVYRLAISLKPAK